MFSGEVRHLHVAEPRKRQYFWVPACRGVANRPSGYALSEP